MRRLLATAIVASALVGCGDSSTPAGDSDRLERSDEGAQHIHGLGVNPADGALLIATHSGLFRAAPDTERAERVGDSRQDTMGFTVVGPDRFLGSGHPDVQSDLPPLLGLIRSDDAGREWEPISLLGEADFHVLRAAGERIYGVNATDGTLLVSHDGGGTWDERTPPGPLIDLIPDPRDPDHLVATGEHGVFASRDGGETWRPRATIAGLLAWPAGDALLMVDASGAVHVSSDAGAEWRQVGEIGGQPAAFAAHESDLYVALHTNEVKVSHDDGRTWQPRVTA